MNKKTNWDAIVIGGGPAGATSAAYLAMQGRKVLLLEKEKRFPRYRLGESLLPSMMPILEDFDLIDAMEEAGFPHKTGGTFVWGVDEEPWAVRFSDNPFLPYPYAYHADRGIFDQMLLDHARTVGVEVQMGAWVRDVILEETPEGERDRVVGVRWAKDGTGPLQDVRASYVVDGSGPASVVGKRVAERTYDDRMRQTSIHTYYEDVVGPSEFSEGHVVVVTAPKGWFWYIPMNSATLGKASVGLVTGQEFRAAISEQGKEAFYEEQLAQAPMMQQMLGPDAKRVGPLRGIRDWAFACDHMAGPGYFLAGDAAAFVDPLLSTGVSLAMLAGYSSAVCIHTLLDDPSMAAPAADFYNSNYGRMYQVTRDALLFFYSGNVLHGDDMFWEARKIMKFGDNVAAKQTFSFLVNVVAANPHPSARKQIAMFHQFVEHIDTPVEDMAKEEDFKQLVERYRGVATGQGAALAADAVPVVNGGLEETCMIDDQHFRLNRVTGVAFDSERPVFSSTASWLLGRNFAPMTGAALQLLQMMDGERSWGDIVQAEAAKRGESVAATERELTPIVGELLQENFVLLKKAVS